MRRPTWRTTLLWFGLLTSCANLWMLATRHRAVSLIEFVVVPDSFACSEPHLVQKGTTKL